MKRALVTGVTGQDGSYMAEFLIEKGYDVHGMVRHKYPLDSPKIERLKSILNNERFHLIYGDMGNSESLANVVRVVRPDEIYNLAAQRHVVISYELPEYTADITGVGVVRLLNAIHSSGIESKFYQACSSELFGKTQESIVDERVAFHPQSPYGCAKSYAFQITRSYRETYNIFACSGILFNHESPRRDDCFVSRKITLGLARIKFGLQARITLGNLDARRDWGYAVDYVKAMWLMMQHEKADDYIISTGKTHSVREFIEEAGEYLGMDIVWEGVGVNEKGFDQKTGKLIIDVSSEHFRPSDVNPFYGDSSKARRELGWEPTVDFKKLVSIMLDSDLGIAEKEKGGK